MSFIPFFMAMQWLIQLNMELLGLGPSYTTELKMGSFHKAGTLGGCRCGP